MVPKKIVGGEVTYNMIAHKAFDAKHGVKNLCNGLFDAMFGLKKTHFHVVNDLLISIVHNWPPWSFSNTLGR